MFSKINSEFHKHAKGFQILVGLMIVVPFVFMIPDTDILGPGYVDTSSEIIGSIDGKEITYKEYEKEAKRFLITQSFTDRQNGMILSVLQRHREMLENKALHQEVLNYMVRVKELEKQNAQNKFSTEPISREETKEVINTLDTALYVLKMQAQQSNRSFDLQAQQAIELLRQNLNVGGAEIDLVINRIVTAKRFDDYLKKSVALEDEEILSRIKKQEKVFKVRTADIETSSFLNYPLKDYYEKNKDSFRDNDAIKASLIVFDPQAYKSEILKTDLTAEVEKAFAEEKKTNDQAEKNAKTIKESLKDRIAQTKAREKAKSMATLIENSLKAKIKTDTKTADILKSFNDLAKASKLAVQESGFHSQKNVTDNDHPINAKVTEAIISLSEKNPVKLLDDQSKFYVLAFNEKGYFKPIEKVRSELLEAVYKEKAGNYYKNNVEDFKLSHRVSTGFIQIYGGLFNSQVTVTPEQAKAIYDANASFNTPQKKLLQFTYELAADSKEEAKAEALKALEAFVKANGSKSAADLAKIDLGKDSKIKRIDLSWVSANDLRFGTDKEIVDEAFKTTDGQFTKIFERDNFVATVFVEAGRESTPFEEVQQQIISAERTKLLKSYTDKKTDDIIKKLEAVKTADGEKITDVIDQIAKELDITPRVLDDMPSLEVMNSQYRQFAPQIIQSIAQRNGVTPAFANELLSLSNERPFTRARSLPNLSKVIGYLIEDKPAGYQTLEEVTEVVYQRLNNSDAQKIASEKAVAAKQELDQALTKPEELKNLMSKNGFKEAKDVKFKEADPTLSKVLAEDPKANEFGSSADANGQATTLVFIESIKEVSEEDIAKVKAEYEKEMRSEAESKKLQDFWTDAMKKYEVKTAESPETES